MKFLLCDSNLLIDDKVLENYVKVSTADKKQLRFQEDIKKLC